MKLIKSIYKTVFYATLAVGLSSCANNWLDLSPSDAVEADGALKTSNDLASARIGLYKALKGTSTFTDYYGAQMFVYGEVRGEDMQYDEENGSGRALFYYQMKYATASEFNTNGIWQSPYITIGRANRIIESAENGSLSDKDENADIIAQYEAEAKVLRALAHFDLVRIYGKTYTEDQGASLGVPVITRILTPTDNLSRNTVQETYTQIIKDLTEAIDSNALLEETTRAYVNKWAAEALLMRVYLTMGDNTKALVEAEDIIKNSPYQLWTRNQYINAWDKGDSNHGNEIIFELSITNSQDWTDREGIGYLYRENAGNISGYGDIVATKSFVDKIQSDPNDIRKSIFLKAEGEDQKKIYEENPVYLNKFPPYNNDVRYANIPILRLSEIYLSAAEAAFKSDNKPKAVEYLNDIISNRTTDETKKVTEESVDLGRILLERRKELVGEGQRFFDAMRNNETITRYTNESDKAWHSSLVLEVRSYNRDYFKALPAIPQNEIDANPAMKGQQNPGY